MSTLVRVSDGETVGPRRGLINFARYMTCVNFTDVYKGMARISGCWWEIMQMGLVSDLYFAMFSSVDCSQSFVPYCTSLWSARYLSIKTIKKHRSCESHCNVNSNYARVRAPNLELSKGVSASATSASTSTISI